MGREPEPRGKNQMSRQTFIIVGASLTGAKAAEELRNRGFDGRVLLIGAESERPYERPPLTKDYLRDESPREKVYVHASEFYEQHQIELETDATVTAIDPAGSRIVLADGRAFDYDRVLLATGAEPRRITIPGAELAGVHYLRTLADCDVLRDRLDAGGHVVVVGAGWIGSEFAASARQRGCDVTLIDPHELPNQRVFGAEIGAFYRDVHRDHGVELALGESVDAFEGDGSVARVRTVAGRCIECDLVVVGIGVTPRVELAGSAGLEVDNGILVSERLQSSAPSVFAAGDVANAWHPFYGERIRLEHWSGALNQGPAAARAMLGEEVSYDRIPYFFSDQYDVGMEYSGHAPRWDQVVFRGDPAEGEFVVFWLRDGRVAAGMNVNVWDVNEHVQTLIRSRQTVDVAALTDPDTPLESLAG
jgi:3-phenylpropionate/trans-cinnamate dioxygenase ferredoxin reductase subunit